MVVPALTVRGVSKSYPGTRALDGIDLVALPGEVHALVGENGAGKSTLVRIIAGVTSPDAGSVEVGGERVERYSPRAARAAGIDVIHQERHVAPDLTVTENILLGRLPEKGWTRISWGAARTYARETLQTLGLDIAPDELMRHLTATQSQLVESARALCSGARVVLMDEPTSSLSGADADQLFRVVAELRSRGVAIVFISHHLEEVLRVADRITVLRDGQVVGSMTPGETDERRLAELIIGRPLTRAPRRRTTTVTSGPPALALANVSFAPRLAGISLAVQPGEIVCVAGAVGSGRRELARIAVGAQRPDNGAVRAFGRPVHGPRQALKNGVVFVSDDRKRESLFSYASALDNLAVGRVAARSAPIYSSREAHRRALLASDSVRFDGRRLRTRVDLLSGGNQQKVVLARWVDVGAKVFVLDEPTAGIDVGARADIYEILGAQVDAGAAVLCFSSDFDEITQIADRALVLRNGQWAGELSGDQIIPEALYALQLGLDQGNQEVPA